MSDPKAKSVPGRPSLGVVAISYNEERDLPGFLACLVGWVDEIVIIDDGSTDATAEIAAAYDEQVKLIRSPRQEGEYYAHQRNKGIQAAESEWLLHMDIDERVPPSLAKEILAAIRDVGKDAYRYRRLNFFLHRPMRGGGWQTWNLVHLAKRQVLQFEGMYHEACVVDASPERIGQLTEAMWHLNDNNYAERMHKSMVYCQEQADRIAAGGGRICWHHLVFRPLVEFVRTFVWKHGYRDGTVGLLAALHSGCAMFRACALVWDRQHPVLREELEEELATMWDLAE